MHSLVGMLSVLSAALCAFPAYAVDLQKMTPAPVLQIDTKCMACQAKCRKCFGTSNRFSSIGECIADCKSKGNPIVNATCGVYRRCYQPR